MSEKTQINSWNPSQIGEAIIGKLVWKGQHETKYGKKNAYIIVGDDGTSVKVWGNQNLDPQLQPLQIRDKISITFLGLKGLTFQDGNPMTDRETGKQLMQKQYKVFLISGASQAPTTLETYLQEMEQHMPEKPEWWTHSGEV